MTSATCNGYIGLPCMRLSPRVNRLAVQRHRKTFLADHWPMDGPAEKAKNVVGECKFVANLTQRRHGIFG